VKIFIVIASIVLLTACNNGPKKSKPITKDSAAAVMMMQVEDVTDAVSTLLPVPISYYLKEAKKWNDKNGENWLLLYETGNYVQDNTATGASAKLSAVLYLKNDTGFVEQWNMRDFIDNCELDITCSFYEKHLSISDLDKNGMAEVMIVYALSCRGDVSPNEKKLILYEGGKKFALRGEEILIMKKDTVGGTYNPDAAFKSLPAVTQDSAVKHFQKFGLTKYE
jgi:hypothetical protein